MEEFYIEYTIENRYETPVKRANFELLIMPATNAYQSVKEVNIYCSEDKELFSSTNIFGFETISYYVDKPFTQFWFKLFAKVEIEKVNPFRVTNLSPSEEYDILHSDDFQIDNQLFLTSTSLTQLPSLLDLAFPIYSNTVSLFDYLLELKGFIYNHLEYSPESTDVNTLLDEVLKMRRGVCQDFAHLFISVCRRNKIPARYVTGYLNQGEGFVGASQLHAWVEVLIPELDWVGFDATNNLLADYHYIKIAHGTDYQDCSPIVGVLETSGKQNSKHLVIVTSNQQQ